MTFMHAWSKRWAVSWTFAKALPVGLLTLANLRMPVLRAVWDLRKFLSVHRPTRKCWPWGTCISFNQCLFCGWWFCPSPTFIVKISCQMLVWLGTFWLFYVTKISGKVNLFRQVCRRWQNVVSKVAKRSCGSLRATTLCMDSRCGSLWATTLCVDSR